MLLGVALLTHLGWQSFGEGSDILIFVHTHLHPIWSVSPDWGHSATKKKPFQSLRRAGKLSIYRFFEVFFDWGVLQFLITSWEDCSTRARSCRERRRSDRKSVRPDGSCGSRRFLTSTSTAEMSRKLQVSTRTIGARTVSCTSWCADRFSSRLSQGVKRQECSQPWSRLWIDGC